MANPFLLFGAASSAAAAPLIRFALCGITGVYLLRGIAWLVFALVAQALAASRSAVGAP